MDTKYNQDNIVVLEKCAKNIILVFCGSQGI